MVLPSRASIANSWLLGHAMSDTTMGSLTHALLCNLTTGPFATGWAMIALLALMAFFAADKRRRAHFERFYYTHMLFLPFFTLWQLHGVRRAASFAPFFRDSALIIPAPADVLHDQVR